MAQDGDATAASLSGVGAGIVVIGAGLGIGKLASAAFESMARQPEVANDIKGAMIIVAAMVEGAAVIGLIVCMIK
ncbi:MAG TPA: ATP synthase F0 subunit C [Fuerstia sp.]|nr:ATP synthase F0 subunit C [Fuerstiella sp.]